MAAIAGEVDIMYVLEVLSGTSLSGTLSVANMAKTRTFYGSVYTPYIQEQRKIFFLPCS